MEDLELGNLEYAIVLQIVVELLDSLVLMEVNIGVKRVFQEKIGLGHAGAIGLIAVFLKNVLQ
jgi:hypothetical protein